MIKLKSLEIGSYKLFKDTELNFEDLSGVVTIQGNNLDIKNFSANSVGKTTFVSSILHCIYGKNLTGESIEKVTNVYTGDKPNITLTFEKEGVDYTIINNYGDGSLRVYQDGVLLEHPRKNDLFKAIEDIVGISHFLMSNLIYISPTSNSIFSSAGNDAQSKFIQQLLNLEFISDIHKKANTDLKSYKGELGLLLKEVTLRQNMIESLEKQLELIPEVEDKDYTQEINNLSGEISQLDIFINSTKKVKDKVDKEFNSLKTRSIELKSSIKYTTELVTERKRLISLGNCPTCSQPTKELPSVDSITELESLNKELNEVIEKGIVLQADIKTLEKDILESMSSKTIKQKELDSYKNNMEQAKNRKGAKEVRENIKLQLASTIGELLEAQQKLQELEKKVYILELITECASPKGFVKERISLFLQLYNIELQKLSRELLGREYIVTINKTKSNHYELTVDDGDCNLSYNSLSSGFKARMDIILTLALNKAVETLTGISINILVLDEIISSVDEKGVETIEKLLGKIQHTFPNKIIFLVSHNQYMRISDKTLMVERDSGTSKFIWV